MLDTVNARGIPEEGRVLDEACPARIAGPGPAHLQETVVRDVLRCDGLGVVGAGGACRVAANAATSDAVVGRTGARRTNRDGSRDECESNECSSYDLQYPTFSSVDGTRTIVSHRARVVIHKRDNGQENG